MSVTPKSSFQDLTPVLVTGATGSVGPHVVHALRAAGCRVRTLSLHPPPKDLLPDTVDVRVGDITMERVVREAMEGTQAVIHLAAMLHMAAPPLAIRDRYEQVNVRGTAGVVAAARQAGIIRIVFFSSIAVYGRSGSEVLSEESPTLPHTYYGQTKLEGERLVLEAGGPDGAPMGTVLRLGAVYGARVKGNYRRLVQALAGGWFIPVGAGINRRTLIYGKDVGKAAVLAAQHPKAAGRVYNVTDGGCHSMLEIIGAICGALGRNPPRMRLPARPVRWVAGLAEDGARLVGVSSRIGRATIDTFVEDFAVSGERIQRELGFKPEFGLERGWEETIREMRRAGDL